MIYAQGALPKHNITPAMRSRVTSSLVTSGANVSLKNVERGLGGWKVVKYHFLSHSRTLTLAHTRSVFHSDMPKHVPKVVSTRFGWEMVKYG